MVGGKKGWGCGDGPYGENAPVEVLKRKKDFYLGLVKGKQNNHQTAGLL